MNHRARSKQDDVWLHAFSLDVFQDKLEYLRIARGELLLATAEDVTGIYVITGGRVRVASMNEEGHYHLHEFLGAGGMIGEMEFLSEKSNPSLSVEAVQETDLILLRKEYWDAAKASVSFVTAVAKVLARKLRGCNARSAGNHLYPLPVRLSSYISLTSDDGRFREPQEITAQMLDVSVRQLQRAFQTLEQKGYLKKEKWEWVILDETRFKEAGCEYFEEKSDFGL